MTQPPEKFPGDTVDGWTPIQFAIAFVAQMRKEKRLTHKPSLRTALAIPKLLTARYFRLHYLHADDYIQSAVLNTPLEDQEIAQRVARDLIFPPKPIDNPKSGSSRTKPKEKAAAALDGDPMASILASLANANIDLDGMDDLDALLAGEAKQSDDLQAYELFEQLLTSDDPQARHLAELLSMFGGPSQMEAQELVTQERCREYAKQQLQAANGTLALEHIVHGTGAGFSDLLLRIAMQPWELAAALAGAGRLEQLAAHLDDLILLGSTRDLGKTIRYLKPFQSVVAPEQLLRLREAGIERAADLTEFVALLDGLDEWLEPDNELIRVSAVQHPLRALAAADWIVDRFNKRLHDKIFNYWRTSLPGPPTLEQLVEVCVRCAAWEGELDNAYRRYLQDIDEALEGRDLVKDGLPEIVTESVFLAERLHKTGNTMASALAGLLVTDVLCRIKIPEMLLGLLDAYLEHHTSPSDINALIEHAQRLGIDPSEIYDRIGSALDQFEAMVRGEDRNLNRLKLLALRIESIPPELAAELVSLSYQQRNKPAIAVLLAVNMGVVCQQGLPTDFVVSCIGFKGIGGGENLLKQWFTHGPYIQGEIRTRIKELAKHALIEIGLDWASRGAGSVSQGLMPQNNVRPFTAADDLDQLDIENTLDAIINEGKQLEEISDEHMMVHDTQSGKASMGVLIDISGSMSGAELSICATSVIMLLGRLQPHEIAVAVFEGSTHIIKPMAEERSLDEVADELLDLQATGGTCVDAALEWIAGEFESDSQADRQVLFLLSDFCFSESVDQLKGHAHRLADAHIQFLGAAHGFTMEASVQVFTDIMGGQLIRLKRFDQLPAILTEAIHAIGDSR